MLFQSLRGRRSDAMLAATSFVLPWFSKDCWCKNVVNCRANRLSGRLRIDSIGPGNRRVPAMIGSAKIRFIVKTGSFSRLNPQSRISIE